jgi:hypothetical protein
MLSRRRDHLMTSLIHHGPVAVRGAASCGLDGEREPLSGRFVMGLRETGTVQILKDRVDSGG